jgi:hypothetical protein
MRTRFWSMLSEEVAEGTGDFDEFSDDLAEFLTFKDLAPPENAACELLVQNTDGEVKAADIWALINFGEEPVLLAWPQLRLKLASGEGCQVSAGSFPEIIPPQADDPNVLLAIRLGPAASA